MTDRTLAAVAAVGFVVVVATSLGTALPARDVALLAAIAGGGALTAGLIGALVLRLLHRSTFSAQVTTVVLTSVGAVAVGAVAAGNAMFLSSHDLAALAVIVATSAVVGVVCGMAVAHRVGAASRTLGEDVRRIADGGEPGPISGPGRIVAVRELIELHEQVRESTVRLERARASERAMDAARRELVSWVSHDLRTPLAGIRALAEALEDDVAPDPETVRRYHRTLREEAERLAGLVDDLFELSLIQSAALKLDFEAADLSDLVSDAIAAAMPLAQAKGVHLAGEATATGLPLVEVSTPAINRVLHNLLENAVRETPPEGAVTVQVGVSEGQAFVQVRDTCGGIADEDLNRVFETGFRGATARTPRGEGGSGLGLAISRGLVVAHDGEITVENRTGGCAFTVRLPLMHSESHSA
jgi:signal transduction histidine kinase